MWAYSLHHCSYLCAQYCCGRNSRTEPRLELRELLKQDQEQD